jgi:hypothetical protein
LLVAVRRATKIEFEGEKEGMKERRRLGSKMIPKRLETFQLKGKIRQLQHVFCSNYSINEIGWLEMNHQSYMT